MDQDPERRNYSVRSPAAVTSRLGRELEFDATCERFIGDKVANQMVSCH